MVKGVEIRFSYSCHFQGSYHTVMHFYFKEGNVINGFYVVPGVIMQWAHYAVGPSDLHRGYLSMQYIWNDAEKSTIASCKAWQWRLENEIKRKLSFSFYHQSISHFMYFLFLLWRMRHLGKVILSCVCNSCTRMNEQGRLLAASSAMH